MFSNPVYTGIGPYPSMIDDETFFSANLSMLRLDGPDQYLVNTIYVLRQALGSGVMYPPIPDNPASEANNEFHLAKPLNIRIVIDGNELFKLAENALSTVLSLQRTPNKTSSLIRDYTAKTISITDLPTIKVRSPKRNKPPTPETAAFFQVNPVSIGLWHFETFIDDHTWIINAVEYIVTTQPGRN